MLTRVRSPEGSDLRVQAIFGLHLIGASPDSVSLPATCGVAAQAGCGCHTKPEEPPTPTGPPEVIPEVGVRERERE
jgi:hypothetical protein